MPPFGPPQDEPFGANDSFIAKGDEVLEKINEVAGTTLTYSTALIKKLWQKETVDSISSYFYKKR